MTYRTATLCALLLLGACSPSNEEKAPAPKLFEEQRDALDKAKTVNPAQQQQDEEQRKAIEKQTQ
ncbi:MAG: hypothetical protein WC825_05865 [Gallionellaceae bacterium]|jgi:hypothetical protein